MEEREGYAYKKWRVFLFQCIFSLLGSELTTKCVKYLCVYKYIYTHKYKYAHTHIHRLPCSGMSCYFTDIRHTAGTPARTRCVQTPSWGKALTRGCKLEAEELPCVAVCQGCGGRRLEPRATNKCMPLHRLCSPSLFLVFAAQFQLLGACQHVCYGHTWGLSMKHIVIHLWCLYVSPAHTAWFWAIYFGSSMRVCAMGFPRWSAWGLSSVHMPTDWCRVTTSKRRDSPTIPARDGYH